MYHLFTCSPADMSLWLSLSEAQSGHPTHGVRRSIHQIDMMVAQQHSHALYKQRTLYVVRCSPVRAFRFVSLTAETEATEQIFWSA